MHKFTVYFLLELLTNILIYNNILIYLSIVIKTIPFVIIVVFKIRNRRK
jgi:hypothetical protein